MPAARSSRGRRPWGVEVGPDPGGYGMTIREQRMKGKIKIIGPKVRGVGYRCFLMNQAMLWGVAGFVALWL